MAKVTTRSLADSRTVLREVLPIDTPFLLGIFLGDICNFKCKYCIQSADESAPEKKELVKNFLEWDTFKKIVDSAKLFPKRIKTVLLTSIGEPLLHPEISRMIAYMRQVDLADAYEIVTNASMLTPALGKQLVDAGLTRLCVSLQGMTAEKYREICGATIDYDQFYNQLKSFYEYSRGRCKVHIKVVDLALDNDEEAFMKMYAPICDTIYVDRIMPVFSGVDYEGVVLDTESFTQEQFEKNRGISCSPVFYTLYTLADGRIAPCCNHPQPMIYGNIWETGLVEAWNSKKRKDFLAQHLTHRRCENKVCSQCIVPLDRKFDSDILDGWEDQILERLNVVTENEEGRV